MNDYDLTPYGAILEAIDKERAEDLRNELIHDIEINLLGGMKI